MKKKQSTTSKKKQATPPRRSVRFSPDPLTLAVIFSADGKTSKPSLVGLVLNESFGGCAVLVNHDGGFKKDQKVKIKVGQLAVMDATVVWVKNLEESIYKVGLKFLD